MMDADKMELTIALAKEALDRGEMPIAAILFHGDRAVAKTYTSEKADRRFLVHAELKALLEADRAGFSVEERRNTQLFTTLEPCCLMCFGAAMLFFVGEVVYSLTAPDDGATRLVDFRRFSGPLVRRQRPIVRGGLLRDSAMAHLSWPTCGQNHPSS